MNEFRTLLLRELREKLSALRPRKGNLSSGIFNLILLAVVLAVVIVVFKFLLETYLKVKIGYEDARPQRAREALTVIYAVAGLVTAVSGIVRINGSITSNRGMNVLLLLPVRRQAILFSKLAALLVELFFTALLTVLPLAAVFLSVVGAGWSFLGYALLSTVVVTVFSFAVASLLALPVHYLVRLISKSYLLLTLVFTALMAGAFLVYSQILALLKGLLETGQIRFVFNEGFLHTMETLCGLLYPSNALAALSLGADTGKNLLLAGLALVSGLGVAFLVVWFLFGMVADSRLASVKEFRHRSRAAKCRSPLAALVRKEFLLILRTPSHAFQFFATMLVLPLMVYVTATLLSSLVRELIYVECGFELSLLCISMFSVLTNTFCASNVSREGRSFSAIKVLPVDGRLYVWSKVLLCSSVSLLSVALSAAVLAAFGVLAVWQAVICFLIAGSLSVGMICLATERDLRAPDFGGANQRAATFMVFWGLAASLLTGGLSLVCAMYFRAKYASATGTLITVCVLFALAALVLVLSVLCLTRNLEKKYREAMV